MERLSFLGSAKRSRSPLGECWPILLQLLDADFFLYGVTLMYVGFLCYAGWCTAFCCDFVAVFAVVSKLTPVRLRCMDAPQRCWETRVSFNLQHGHPGTAPSSPWLCELEKRSPAVINLSLMYLDPTQAQLAERFSGKVSFPIHTHSYKVSFPHSDVLISQKCCGSIFLLQCHFLKISMFLWKIWITSQLENRVRKMSTSFSSERSHSLTEICKAFSFLRWIYFFLLCLDTSWDLPGERGHCCAVQQALSSWPGNHGDMSRTWTFSSYRCCLLGAEGEHPGPRALSPVSSEQPQRFGGSSVALTMHK